jgi:hypothetical protein
MANFFDALLDPGDVFGGGGLDEALGSSGAGAQQVKTARNALDFQRGMATQLRADAAPLRELRNNNLNYLSDLTSGNRGRFYASPEYRTVDNAARTVIPGAPGFAADELMTRSNALGEGEYGNFYNRTANVAGISTSGLNTTNQQLQQNINAQASLLQDAGTAAASDIMGASNTRNEAAGTAITGILAAFSDARLKDDIVELFSIGPLMWCQWRWNRPIDQPACGFIAQQVQKLFPDAVGERGGFLTVNYARVWQWLSR